MLTRIVTIRIVVQVVLVSQLVWSGVLWLMIAIIVGALIRIGQIGGTVVRVIAMRIVVIERAQIVLAPFGATHIGNVVKVGRVEGLLKRRHWIGRHR